MIDFLSSWAEQIVIVVIVTTIIELILPENKIKKYVKTVIGIYIMFTIISPFININEISLANIENYLNETINNSSNIDQTSMDNRLQDLYIEEIQKDVSKQVEEAGYITEKCEVDANLEEGENQGINKINIKISKKENTDNQVSKINQVSIKIGETETNNTQITKEEINNLKEKLSNYYEIDKKKININY